MPRRKKADGKELVKMVEAGEVRSDIMKKLGYKTATQLKTAYMNALIELGKVTPIKGGRGFSKQNGAKQVKVGKRGSIIIPRELVTEMGFGGKDQFTVQKTRAGIALRRA